MSISTPSEQKEPAIDDQTRGIGVTTAHEITIDGQVISYKATAGYLTLNDDPRDEAKPEARIFFTAYIREGIEDISKRPITFAFNGGPGSASLWIHLGALGPRRPAFDETYVSPAPLEDNPHSWLATTDLVFIDPMSTGFSHSSDGGKAQEFYGYEKDVASIGRFIRLFITRSGRWSSPKFIAGESYGCPRAIGLCDYLVTNYGMAMNGLLLISGVLNFQMLDFTHGNDTAYPLFLPTYAATAWYHKKLRQDMQKKSLEEVLREAEDLAIQEYPATLLRGDLIPPRKRSEIANRLSRLTGLPVAFIEQHNLRIPASKFFYELLKDERRVVGRLDSRFNGIAYAPDASEEGFDPSTDAIHGLFCMALNDYMRRELNFKSDLSYVAVAKVTPWPLKDNQFLDVAATLRKSMSRMPHLKVWLSCGYYDLATPYFSNEIGVAQMMLDPSIRPNLTMTTYEAGHMFYIHQPSLVKFKKDFEAFARNTLVEQR